MTNAEHKIARVPRPAALGVLGGMGPRATHYFTEALLAAIEARHRPEKDQDYPNIFVRYACDIPDRTLSLITETDREHLFDLIAREAEILLELGCEKLVMPCITTHAALDSRLSQLPFIDVRSIVAAQVASSFPTARVGVLATSGARLSHAVDKLVPKSQSAICLDSEDERRLMAFIYGQAKTWRAERDVSVLDDLADKLRQRGCDLIVAGCTEVEMCLARSPRQDTTIVLPLRSVAEFYATTWSLR